MLKPESKSMVNHLDFLFTKKKKYSFGKQQKIFSEQLRVCGEGKYYHNLAAKFVGAV